MAQAKLDFEVPPHLKREFVFQTAGILPPNGVLFGFNTIKKVGEQAAKLGSKQDILVTDEIMVQLGYADLVKEALQKVVELRNRVSQTASERTRREQRINEITQEQARIRENMKVLNQTSEVYRNYEKEFVQQDTDIKNLRKEIEQIRTTEAKQQKELNDYLLAIDIE